MKTRIIKQQIERVTVECLSKSRALAWESYFNDASWQVVKTGPHMGMPGYSVAIFERVNFEHVISEGIL